MVIHPIPVVGFSRNTILAVLFALAGFPAAAWAHGGGASPGHTEPRQSDPAAEKRDAESYRRARVESLQVKIDGLDEKLENPKLSTKKRAKLEKKLKKLLDEKNKLLEGPR
jgi:hypothetical protein